MHAKTVLFKILTRFQLIIFKIKKERKMKKLVFFIILTNFLNLIINLNALAEDKLCFNFPCNKIEQYKLISVPLVTRQLIGTCWLHQDYNLINGQLREKKVISKTESISLHYYYFGYLVSEYYKNNISQQEDKLTAGSVGLAFPSIYLIDDFRLKDEYLIDAEVGFDYETIEKINEELRKQVLKSQISSNKDLSELEKKNKFIEDAYEVAKIFFNFNPEKKIKLNTHKLETYRLLEFDWRKKLSNEHYNYLAENFKDDNFKDDLIIRKAAIIALDAIGIESNQVTEIILDKFNQKIKSFYSLGIRWRSTFELFLKELFSISNDLKREYFNEVYNVSYLQKLKERLDQNQLIAMDLYRYKKENNFFYKYDEVNYPNGHAVVLSGYFYINSTLYFIIHNSHGMQKHFKGRNLITADDLLKFAPHLTNFRTTFFIE